MGPCEWAQFDGIEEGRTNWRHAMILTFLIYIEMLHLPKLSSASSFTSARHLLHLVSHKAPTAHLYAQCDEHAHKPNQIHIVHTALSHHICQTVNISFDTLRYIDDSTGSWWRGKTTWFTVRSQNYSTMLACWFFVYVLYCICNGILPKYSLKL